MHTSQFLWQGLEWSWSLSFWLVAIATAVGLIILLMQYERRLIPKRVGNALLVLRLVVLTVLLLTLLQIRDSSRLTALTDRQPRATH